jgi:diaminopimelate epimerase
MNLPSIPFTKMHGLGNDFVVLNAFTNTLPPNFDFAAWAQVSCARHFGIGADGLLLLCAPDEWAQARGASVQMRMWNPDGSEDMCGNGLRCVARLAHNCGAVSSSRFIAQTLAGLRGCEILEDVQVRVAMGQPDFRFAAIPFAPSGDIARAIEYSISVGNVVLPHVTTLSTGSTHTIIFVDELPSDEMFSTISPQIEHHAWFPERTSIMWAQVLDRENIRLRIWERGAGETLACGTGSCAAAVAAQITERCGELVRIHSRGGVLQIGWRQGEEIQMTGEAKVVYEGVWK